MRRSQINWRDVLADDEDEVPRRRTNGGGGGGKKKSSSSIGSKIATAAGAVAIPLGLGLTGLALARWANESGFTGDSLRRLWWMPDGAADAVDAEAAKRGRPMVVDAAADAEVDAPDIAAPPDGGVGGAPAAPAVRQPDDQGLQNQIVPMGTVLDQRDRSGLPAVDLTVGRLRALEDNLMALFETQRQLAMAGNARLNNLEATAMNLVQGQEALAQGVNQTWHDANDAITGMQQRDMMREQMQHNLMMGLPMYHQPGILQPFEGQPMEGQQTNTLVRPDSFPIAQHGYFGRQLY
jgi:hypothetical protein